LLHYQHLSNSKNLLAFSAGVDSSALFFMLLDSGVSFDIALVNYGIRDSANEEERHAKSLAEKYNINLHTIKAPLYDNNFEANARAFRYDFFKSLIDRYAYDNLLTAHQLNDQLEWLLMRLSRGAGVAELLGLESMSKRVTSKKREFTLIRPLLDRSKEELLDYLAEYNHPYFVDESNSEYRYERNRFRAKYSEPLMREFSAGIRRSFEYLHKDKAMLLDGIELLFSYDELRVYRIKENSLKSKAADLALKELGYLLSSAQRKEIDGSDSIVIGGRWAVVYQESRLYISPFLNTTMEKKYKDLCRISSLPIKIRAYCFSKNIKPMDIMKL